VTPVYEPCPVDGCTRRHQPHYLMCRPCWSKVPRHLRDAVYAAVATWRRTYEDADFQAMRAVQREAIAAAGG
jgi:hypothetical protein